MLRASGSTPPTSPSTCWSRSRRNCAKKCGTSASGTACNASAPSLPSTNGGQPPASMDRTPSAQLLRNSPNQTSPRWSKIPVAPLLSGVNRLLTIICRHSLALYVGGGSYAHRSIHGTAFRSYSPRNAGRLPAPQQQRDLLPDLE